MKFLFNTSALGTLVAAAILATGCTKNYYENTEGNGDVITLSSEVQFGATPRIQDTQIVEGQSLSLFVTNTGSIDPGNQIYQNNRITADGAGGFTYRLPMYYPTNGQGVDFYAVHPYSPAATLENPLNFILQTDQTDELNYLMSDLLFGARNNVVPPQNNAVELLFYHKLSKLDFIIKTSDPNINLSNLSGIDILGLLPETTINIVNGEISAATGVPTPINVYGNPQLTGNPGNQRVTGYTAIIIPQTAPAAEQLFSLTIGGNLRYYTPLEALSFASGTKYTVTLDITDDQIILTSQIDDWTDGGSIGGPAGPQ